MNHRYCIKCGQVISPILEGNLCSKCLDKMHGSDLYYDTKDMSRLLCVGERQVRRKALEGEIPGKIAGVKRHLFFKTKVDQWLKTQQPIPKVPTSPLQAKAHAMCKRGDHSWLAEEEYAGNSYSIEDQDDIGEHSFTFGSIHTCYFCGHKEYFQFGEGG